MIDGKATSILCETSAQRCDICKAVPISVKFCRKANNEDILNNLIISSDSYISSKRHKMIRKHKPFSEEAKAMLLLSPTFEDDERENIEFVNVEHLENESESESDDIV